MRGRNHTPSPPRGYGRRGRSPSPRGRYVGRSRDMPASLLVRNLRHDCRTSFDLIFTHNSSCFALLFFFFKEKNGIELKTSYLRKLISCVFSSSCPIRSPVGYSWSPPPRRARSRSHSRDYYSPPAKRRYSSQYSPHPSQERSHSRSPPIDGSRSRSESPARGKSGSRSRSPPLED
ncbi:hypothetical protein ACJRO7_004753 [Eucalyptus globulus]|uniref:Uncharacterized protein n=1 Tax=Eucalyptus globulus TaxID=34317 RepID=A0ABD3IXN1_EUCGL